MMKPFPVHSQKDRFCAVQFDAAGSKCDEFHTVEMLLPCVILMEKLKVDLKSI